jgi:hypothetical protein
MLNANQLITQATQDVQAPGFLVAGQNKLQIILDELCLKHSFSAARGVYYFTLNPGLITTVGGITNFGGPYPLPLDFLRTSETSGSEGVQYAFFYVFNGVPYPLQPWDLGRIDMQVQQPGIQNLPYAYATDLSPESTAADYIVGTTTAAMSQTSTVITCASVNYMITGQGLAGNGVPAGATITAITSSNQTVTMSAAATATFQSVTGAGAAAIMFGTQPNAYVYPGPSGAFPAILRYQRLMPPLLDFTRVPWFPDQAYLIDRLSADLSSSTTDPRRKEFLAQAEKKLGAYETFEGDKTNRAQTVILDRRRFGRAFSKLNNTKTIGW